MNNGRDIDLAVIDRLIGLHAKQEAYASNDADFDFQRVFKAVASKPKMLEAWQKVIETKNFESVIVTNPKNQPRLYGWNCVKEFPPGSNKLQLYTISGIGMVGKFSEFADGFITHGAYMLPSPSKQAGKLK